MQRGKFSVNYIFIIAYLLDKAQQGKQGKS